MSNTTNPPPIPEKILDQAKAFASKQYEVTDSTTFSYIQQDAAVAGYIACFQALSSPTGESAGRWVRALERTSPDNKLVCFRSNGMLFTGWYDSHRKVYDDVKAGVFPLRSVEWLDESPSQPSAGMEFEDYLSALREILAVHRQYHAADLTNSAANHLLNIAIAALAKYNRLQNPPTPTKTEGQ